VSVGGGLYVDEPNHGEIDRVSLPGGAVSRVVDVSASQGHIVPTALAYKGNFFVGNLGLFPVSPGTEAIFKLTPSGQLKPWATGLTTILGLAFDGRDRLYVLESITAAGLPGRRSERNRTGRPHRSEREADRGRRRPDDPDRDDDGSRRGALRLEHRLRAADPGAGAGASDHRLRLT
jgi:hypothetical protein